MNPHNKHVGLMWFPIWVEKWVFGSTRHELLPDERSVWLDLLCLASMNDGHIYANEGMPYPLPQLAGLLVIPLELLQRTIDKCLKYEKLEVRKDDTLYVTNWKQYRLSERHRKRFSKKLASYINKSRVEYSRVEYSRVKDDQNTDTLSQKTDTMSEKRDTPAPAVVPSITAQCRDFMEYYNAKLKAKMWLKRDLTLNFMRKRLIESRLKEYKLEDLKLAVDNFVKDDWPERYKYLDPRYCIGIIGGRDHLERWLNAPETEIPWTQRR